MPGMNSGIRHVGAMSLGSTLISTGRQRPVQAAVGNRIRRRAQWNLRRMCVVNGAKRHRSRSVVAPSARSVGRVPTAQDAAGRRPGSPDASKGYGSICGAVAARGVDTLPTP